LGIRRTGKTWRVKTPRGNVTARSVIVANNAFAKSLGVGSSRVAAIYTYAALTNPLPRERLSRLGSDHAWGLLPAHRLGSTLRRTADARLLIRSCYDYESESDNDDVESILADALQRRFPLLGNIRFAQVWGGATGLTLNGAPLWGEVDDNLYVSAGCNGGGVVKGTLFGSALTDLAHSKAVPDLQALFGSARWMPPDPLRRIGFELISGLERRRGRAEI
jgi:glycine/D-amino acid oxidase-like deaminating enzyme